MTLYAFQHLLAIVNPTNKGFTTIPKAQAQYIAYIRPHHDFK